MLSSENLPEGSEITLESFKPSTMNPERNKRIAVHVQNACKSYGKGPRILNDLNMNVERGTIYGLLGASGCGKTTILSSIVGLSKLDDGQIWVYGAKPGTKESGIPGKTIGYMPQDLALNLKFTIIEVLHYFGRIYGMKRNEINERMEFLMTFLDLPQSNRLIGSLSGGQQRRVGLAVAMIHTPALLILDEPTVGMDPLLVSCIWSYLIELVSRNRTTVIITTHYIEEARQADTVGLMRNGRLLVENNPQALLKEHNTDLLEDIVLKLCKKDNMELQSTADPNDEVSQAIEEMSFYSRKRPSSTAPTEPVMGLTYKSKTPDDDDTDTVSNRRKSQLYRRRQSVIETVNDGISRQADKVLALVIRNCINLLRSPLFLFGLLVLPTFQVILFNLIIGKDPANTPLGIINNEFEDENFFEFCKQRNNSCMGDGLSCRFFENFPQNQINWKIFPTPEDALRSVHAGNSVGFLTIPENFTNHMRQRVAYGIFVENDTLDGSSISFHMDFSDHLKTVFLNKEIYGSYLEFIKEAVTDCKGDPRTVEIPLKYNAIYGDLESGTLEYMQPPQILLNLFLLPMAVGVTYVLDKKAGTLDRTLVAGVDYVHVIISLLITEGCMMILELLLALSVLVFIFNFVIKGSIVLVFILSFLMGICGLSFGFLFGVVCDSELAVLFSILTVYLPSLTSSGATWPREGVQPWARYLLNLLPAALPSEAIRSIVSRGVGFTHVTVWPGFLILIAWIIVCCVASIIIQRKRS